MGTARRIAKNTFYLVSGSIAQKILSFILIVILARELGVSGFGLYSFAFAFVFLFNVVMDLGINFAVFREVAADRSKAPSLVGDALAIKLFIGLATVLLVWLFAGFVKSDPFAVFLVLIAAAVLVLESTYELLKSVFYAFERMKYALVLTVFYHALLLALVAGVLFFSTYGIAGVFLSYLAAASLTLVFAFLVYFLKVGSVSFSFSPSRYRSFVLLALPFSFMTILGSIYAQTDVVMLEFFKGDAAVGIYSSAFRLVRTAGFISAAYMTAVFPVLTRFFAGSQKNFRFLYERSFKYIVSIALPIAVGGFLLSDRIIQFIYGAEFLGTGAVLRFLLFEMVLVFFTILNTHALNSMKLEKKALAAIAVATAVNVLLNFWLIPLYGAVGGAMTSIASEFLLLVLQFFVLFKVIGWVNLPRFFIKPLASSAVMGFFVVSFFGLNLFWLIAGGAILFLALMFLLKGFNQEDIQLFKKILGRSS